VKEKVKVIGFDADDTLWINENYYRATEDRFAELLSAYGDPEQIKGELFKTEMKNLELFGYGVKPFIISMVETAIRVSDSKISNEIIEQMLDMGRGMLREPVELLPGVEKVLQQLHGKYRLIVATKGDLLDQERKLKNSGLAGYFHHIEVMSDKTQDSYAELISHLDIRPEEFVMIGNSMRSDILPPYELGSYVIYIPYEMTWQHETNVEEIHANERYYKYTSLEEILEVF